MYSNRMNYEHELTYLEVKQGVEAIKEEIRIHEITVQVNRIQLKAMENELKNHKPPKLPPVEKNKVTG